MVRKETQSQKGFLKLCTFTHLMSQLSGKQGVDVKGFLAKFLFEKAQNCWNSLDLQGFEEIVALFIYGMVLFPNPDQLIDVNTVKIFIP